MQYGSFYGGKPGIAPVIIARYDSIADMTDQFSQGGNFNEVGYGQYVIIDTAINGKYSSPQNGIVYRRGMDYNDKPKTIEQPEPEYQETGHESETVEQFKQRHETWLKTTFKKYALNPGAGAVYVGKIVGPRGMTAALKIVDYTEESESYEVTSLGLGKPGNDEVRYQYYNIEDNQGNITEYRVAFAIPGYGLHISAKPDSPYIAEGAELATKDGSNSGDFYSKWDIKVPRGKHGTDVENLAVYTSNTDNDQYLGVQYRDYQGSAAGTVKPQSSDPDYDNGYYKLAPYRVIKDITDNSVASGQRPLLNLDPTKNIIVGVKYNGPTGFPNDLCLLCIKGGAGTGGSAGDFSNKGEGYQGFYGEAKLRVVKKTDVPASTVTVDYTQGDDQSFSIRLLDDIQLDDNGQLYAKYTDEPVRLRLGTVQDIIKVDFIKEVNTYDNQGQIVTSNYPISKIRIKYNTYKKDGSGNIVIDDKFTQASSGATINYPTTDDEGRMVEWLETPIKFIDSFRRDPNTGKLYIKYSTDKNEQPFYDAMKSITKVELNNNNYLKFTWDTGDTIILDNGTDPGHAPGLPMDTINTVYIKSVDVDPSVHPNAPDLSKQQQFYLKTNTDPNGGTKEEKISENLNYIVDVRLEGDLLCILWSSPYYRDHIPADRKMPLDYTKDGRTYQKIDYQVYDSISKGEHIIGNFPSLAALQAAYPNGFGKDSTTANRAGWVATVKETDPTTGAVTTKLYAYDYINPNNKWYQIYNMTDSAVNPQTVMMVDSEDANLMPSDPAKHSKLQPGGYWFVKFNEGQDLEYDIASQQSITNLFTT